MKRASLIAAVLACAAPSHAEPGLYYSQNAGVAMARGALAPSVGNALHLRIAGGVRWSWFAIEPWLRSDVQFDREGAWQGVFGGTPAEGRADLDAYGIDVKLITPLHHARGARFDGYLRGGPSLVKANGALEGYRGPGFGVSAGLQVAGKVSALGFLFLPLLFVDRGPRVTGALYIEQGYDFVRMRRLGSPSIDARVAQVGLGFAIGSAF